MKLGYNLSKKKMSTINSNIKPFGYETQHHKVRILGMNPNRTNH